MALNETIGYNGINLTYHKILVNSQDVLNSNTRAILASYVDQAAREANDAGFFTTFDFNIALLDQTRQNIYDYIKTQDGWTTATDI